VDGALVFDQASKAKAVDSFFEQLLGSAPDRGFSLDLDFLGMQVHDLAGLEVAFTEEEVWNVVRAQELDKRSGPDSFTGRFYTSCWHIIKADVMEVFQSLWSGEFRGFHATN
jgi:hypothetical protein